MSDFDEAAVGITEFMSECERFSCEFKRYFEDFHVKEINLEGKVAHLSELITKHQIVTELKTQKQIETAPLDNSNSSTADLSPLTELVGEEDTLKISDLLSSASAYCLLSNISDKEVRTRFHNLIKSNYAYLYSDTQELDGQRFLRVWKKKEYTDAQKKERSDFHNSKNGRPGSKQSKQSTDSLPTLRWGEPWPKDRPPFLHFILYKENKDSMEAVGHLARCLRKNPKFFNIAGIKDRRAVTVQWVSVYRTTADQIRRVLLNPDFDSRAIKMSDFTYQQKRLQVGHLYGNRFEVVLRGVSATSSLIDSSMNCLKSNGFLNYFGLQRFGTRATKTHLVGAAVAARDWQKAVHLVLGHKDDLGTPEPIREYLSAHHESIESTRSASEALKKMQNESRKIQSVFRNEITLLTQLSHQSNNFHGALQALGKTVKFYLHGLQSFLFNAALSERIRKYGRQIVVGDLVFKRNEQSNEATEETFEDDQSEIDEYADDFESIRIDAVELVTKDNINQFSLADVVLPLPGSLITSYPVIVDRHFYAHQCETHLDCSLEEVEAALTGSYRRVLETPTDMTWELINGPKAAEIRLIKSDISKLLESSTEEPAAGSYVRELLLEKDYDETSALVFSCSLRASSYLTMAIREIAVQTRKDQKHKEMNLSIETL